VTPFCRPHAFLEPLSERDVIGETAHERHGEVRVCVDEAWEHQAAAGVEDFARGGEVEELVSRTHRCNAAVRDGNGAVVDGLAVGLHGQDGAAEDQNLPRRRQSHGIPPKPRSR